MVRFFDSVRWTMKAIVPWLDGGIIFASGIPAHALARRELSKHDHLGKRMLDPQLYLSGLDAARATSSCARLASYGWFGNEIVPGYTNSRLKQNEWTKVAEREIVTSWTQRIPTTPTSIEDAVRRCIELQCRLKCEALILPAPLISTLSDDMSTELAWIDTGLALSKRMAPGIPRLATVAISDACLRAHDPWHSVFLDMVLDQISARSPDGVYVVIEQSHSGNYETNPRTLGALIRLVRDFRASGISNVVVPLSGTAGVLGVAFGASTWSTGWFRSQRHLHLADFEDSDEPKTAYPSYYSHQLAGDVHLKLPSRDRSTPTTHGDLDTINKAGLIDVAIELTQGSRDLVRALRAGFSVADVPEWEFGRSNVTAARKHFTETVIRQTRNLNSTASDQRLDHVKFWLDNAMEVAEIISKHGGISNKTTVNHQRVWRAALDEAST